jgi:NADH-quinone oxidoreductase subunit N
VSVVQTVDQAALAPVYALAAAAVLVLLADLAIGPDRRWSGPALLGLGALGPVAALVAAMIVGSGRRGTFCTAAGVLPGDVRVGPSCSFVVDGASLAVTVLGCALALAVLALSVPVVRAAVVPAGEYVFLLLCSLLGLVVLASARDLLTLLVAVETLTLPVYILVGLVRKDGAASRASADAAVTFFVTSVVATALTLLGIALLYGVTGAVHLDRVAAVLAAGTDDSAARTKPLIGAASVLVLAGLLFKLAAVPFHAWAPATYDGAPLPVTAWLATGSKLGGTVALLVTVGIALRPLPHVVGPALALVAVVTMTVGNLVALRQRRVVRLLAWSAVAQTGYLVAALGLVALADSRADLREMIAAVAAFTALYLVASVGTFAAVVALRGAGDGGTIDDLRGAAKRAPWATAALVLGLAGLAGLPPGFAGLFAKVVVVRAALDGSAGWLAVVIGLNAVIGLAYYARMAAACFGGEPAVDAPVASVSGVALPVRAAVLATATAGLVLGGWPQWVLDAADAVAAAFR